MQHQQCQQHEQHDPLRRSGTPVKGGTLNMLGAGDVDYMDPNISYYSIGYLACGSGAGSCSPTRPDRQDHHDGPDLATRVPATATVGISADGKTYTITHPRPAPSGTPARRAR